jgi:hypothetical protein
MFDDVDDGDMSSGLGGLEKKVSSATLDVVSMYPMMLFAFAFVGRKPHPQDICA